MLAESPEIFARLLAVHTGDESVLHFVFTSGLKTASRLLFQRDRTTLSSGRASQLITQD
jgi:hypothetical protein